MTFLRIRMDLIPDSCRQDVASSILTDKSYVWRAKTTAYGQNLSGFSPAKTGSKPRPTAIPIIKSKDSKLIKGIKTIIAFSTAHDILLTAMIITETKIRCFNKILTATAVFVFCLTALSAGAERMVVGELFTNFS